MSTKTFTEVELATALGTTVEKLCGEIVSIPGMDATYRVRLVSIFIALIVDNDTVDLEPGLQRLRVVLDADVASTGEWVYCGCSNGLNDTTWAACELSGIEVVVG